MSTSSKITKSSLLAEIAESVSIYLGFKTTISGTSGFTLAELSGMAAEYKKMADHWQEYKRLYAGYEVNNALYWALDPDTLQGGAAEAFWHRDQAGAIWGRSVQSFKLK